MAYDNTNSGAMFKNKEKTEPRHPDYRGSVNVDGTDYWVSGWIKTAGPNAANPGSKFLSLAMTKKEGRNQSPVRRDSDLFDDDIPF